VHMKEEISIIVAWVLLIYTVLSPVIAVCDANNNCQQGIPGNRTLYLDNNSMGYIVGANCGMSVYDSNWTLMIDNGNMTELGNGFYSYTLSGANLANIGEYTVHYDCDKDAVHYYAVGTFDVVIDTPSNLFNYWNTTLFTDLQTKVNATWYNAITPISDLILNIFSYLDENLNVQFNQTVITNMANQTAQQVWNTTVTGPKEVEITPDCRNIPTWDPVTRRYVPIC